MVDDNIKQIHKNKIILTNNDILMLANNGTPLRQAFDKFQKISTISGTILYWSYRILKKVFDFANAIENSRMNLIKDFCKKDEKGEPVLLGGEYQFDPDQKKLFDEEIALLIPSLSQEEKDKIAEKFCKKGKDNNPIKTKGNLYTFNPEEGESFQKAFVEIMNMEIIFPFDKIVIPSATLEKMQVGRDPKEHLTVEDMILLDKLFEFTE